MLSVILYNWVGFIHYITTMFVICVWLQKHNISVIYTIYKENIHINDIFSNIYHVFIFNYVPLPSLNKTRYVQSLRFEISASKAKISAIFRHFRPTLLHTWTISSRWCLFYIRAYVLDFNNNVAGISFSTFQGQMASKGFIHKFFFIIHGKKLRIRNAFIPYILITWPF